MRFLDVFSGIGGFRMGLENAGHTCIGHIEKDKYALKSYRAIYDIKEGEYEGKDITEIEDFTELKGKFELLTGGFPCQSFSIAGLRKGFEDTRGTMFFYLAKILEQTKPLFFLFENVKGLLSHDGGVLLELSSLRWMPLGITRSGNCLTLKTSEFHKTEKGSILQDILEKEVDEKYFLSKEQAEKIMGMNTQQQYLQDTEEAEEKHILRVSRRY